MILVLIQVSGDLPETHLGNETGHPRARADTTEEKVRNKLFELAMKMSEKETSSGEDQESEPKTESEHQKGSLSSEDNSQSIQEELKKVRTGLLPPGLGKGSAFAEMGGVPKELPLKWPSPGTWGDPGEPFAMSSERLSQEPSMFYGGLQRPLNSQELSSIDTALRAQVCGFVL